KATAPFSGGRSYYSHPSSRQPGKPLIMHQSSATGMQAIPATGAAHGFLLKQQMGLLAGGSHAPVVVCSLGDASITEGEVSEALQVATLYQLPILYLVQDNGWGISVTAAEARAQDAVKFAQGFKGLTALRIDGTDFETCYRSLQEIFAGIRQRPHPVLVQATVPLLGHHTSGVRREFYRQAEELTQQQARTPVPRLRQRLLEAGVLSADALQQMEQEVAREVEEQFNRAVADPEPLPETVSQHVFAPTPVSQERGQRQPPQAAKVPMVDAALFAIREIMEDHPEAVLYGQDVGRRLGGVFREAATLAERFGDHRVFNTAIQEAYIMGSTAGMSAVGIKPIVEVQFADYVYPALNQLVCEVAKSSYLTAGKFPVQTLLRVPTGAYGGGGPYHSGSIESTLLSIKGIKVAYPSNAADMKGLMKAAFLDPNPVVMLEHKGLYWSKVPGTEGAKRAEPGRDYVLPLGVGCQVLSASQKAIRTGISACIITYGMGVYWALQAAATMPGQIEIIDLRTLYPLDEALVYEAVKRHGKCLVLTEEQCLNSFAEALTGRIQQACFSWLDAPVQTVGALPLPAVPINLQLEKAMLPNAQKVAAALQQLLAW
ncbi:MAG TPA: thiamine pyrophosphate-dependent enzyme, partial [Phnomibacter sp.]|nr:thiamine pyrophosphate-dependent enzyme [Phnomibacter sp.]